MKNQPKAVNTAILQSIIWLILLPQSILLLLNFRSWGLISGEAEQNQINAALIILVFEVLVLVVASTIYWLHRQGKLAMGLIIALIGFIAHAGYLLLFVSTINSVIPPSVQPWVVNEGNVGRWNITLFMPGAFFALYGFTKSFFSKLNHAKGRWLTLGLTLGTPLLWYLFSTLLQPAWFGQISIVGWIIIVATIATLFLAAIINAFDTLLHKEFSTRLVEKHYIAAVLLGLAAPLGGLYLNRSIPFPVDFQATNVYVLTVLNGLILLLMPGKTSFLTTKYFLRCLSLPFIAYFFLVFLPFLPLSIIAILAIGAGFLMLTPLVLGLFQFRVTLSEYELVVAEKGKANALLITLTGLLILPGYFVVESLLDKVALDKTLNYFYSPDIMAKPITENQIKRSADALVQLRDRKSDVQMPYIAGFYNYVVFGDMVLPDKKIEQTYKWLTNQALPEPKSEFMSRGVGRRLFWNNVVAPKTDVSIEKLEQVSSQLPNNKTIRLTLKNKTINTHTMFREEIHIPEGVFITGLRLKIEDEWVDGRLFDKKTALWVFEKITEVRRDPAIIYYTSPTTFELRVYPFPANGIREVEFDLQYHSSTKANIKIGNKAVHINPNLKGYSLLSEDGKTVIDKVNHEWVRKRYLHVILDYSQGAKLSTSHYIDKIVQLGKELGVTQVKIAAANISSSNNKSNRLIDISDHQAITNQIDSINLEVRGGMWLEQALANELQVIGNELNDTNLNKAPIFAVVTGAFMPLDTSLSNLQWHQQVPDAATFIVLQNNTISWYSLETGKLIEGDAPNKSVPVVAVRVGKQIQIYAANSPTIANFNSSDNVSIYNSRTQQFETLTLENEASDQNNNWAKLAAIWNSWKKNKRNPAVFESQRQAFLDASRENSLLLPSVAYIVVESDSQWKMLERKEEQSIKNHSALEFEEEQQASEPAWWILLLCVVIFIMIRDRAKKQI